MITTKQKLEQRHETKKGDTEQVTMKNHQLIKVDRKSIKKTMWIQNNQKAKDKMSVISPYISNNHSKHK